MGFSEFKKEWQSEATSRKSEIKWVFIVTYPDDLEWTFAIEKQTQTTCLMTSGGDTGAGSGHHQILCYESELHDVMCNLNSKHQYAMVVSIGMVFSMIGARTPISEFKESEDYFCRGHIIARPGRERAFLHPQHLEVNLNTWRNIGRPNLRERYPYVDKSDQNVHDDYTPLWIEFEGMPRIDNFSNDVRADKAWSYFTIPKRLALHEKRWPSYKFYERPDPISENYFKILENRMAPTYFLENTEYWNEKILKDISEKTYDTLALPASGFLVEFLARHLDHQGEILFYDILQSNLDIKRMQLNLCPSTLKEVLDITKRYGNGARVNYGSGKDEKLLYRKSTRFGNMLDDMEDTHAAMERLVDVNPYDFMKINLCNVEEHGRLMSKLEGKRVLFSSSNIFSYHPNHLVEPLHVLNAARKELVRGLKDACSSFVCLGTRPDKHWVMIDESVCS